MTAPLQVIALSFSRGAGSEGRILAEVDRLRGRGVLRLLDMLFRGWSSDQRGSPFSGGGPAPRGRRFVMLGKDGKGGIMYTDRDPL